jgi:hypothetical protein
MWPYTQDEVKWLALPLEREAAERTQRAIAQRWLKEIGVLGQPANDEPARATRAVSPQSGR